MMYSDCTAESSPCQRTCYQCGENKPEVEFMKAHYTPKKKKSSAYTNQCLQCNRDYNRKRYKPVPQTIPDGYKRCARRDACIHPEGPILPRNEGYFYARRRTSGTVDYVMCKVCEKEQHRIKQETPEYLARQVKLAAEREERARVKAEKKSLPKPVPLTPDERRERNRLREKQPHRKVAHSKYLKTPKGRATNKIAQQRRRSKVLGIPESFTVTEWIGAINYFNGCAACGKPIPKPEDDYTIAPDHWIPVSSPACPGTIVTNMVPLCHGVNGCNNSKHNYMPHEWVIKRFGDTQAAEIENRIIKYFSTCSVLPED